MNSNVEELGNTFPAVISNGFYGRNSKWLLLLLAIAAPAVLFASAKLLTPGDMSGYLLDVSHWLPQRKSLVRDMKRFSEVAGRDRGNVVRISWDGCKTEDARRLSFARELKTLRWPAEMAEGNTDRPLFDDVLTIEDIVKKFEDGGVELTRAQIDSQLENVIIGSNGTTCVVATLPTRDPAMRAYALAQLNRIPEKIKGLDVSELRMFGGPVYTAKVDDSGQQILKKFTPISVSIAILCAWFCLRRLTPMLAVFLNALVTTCAALTSLYLMDAQMDPLLMLIPGFWFIMGISAGMHFVNYYIEVRQHYAEDSADHATITARMAFRPAALATLTTCIGLASLCTSEIMPVWRFGLYSSVGLACGFVAMYLFLPAFLHVWGGRIASDNLVATPIGKTFWDWHESFVMQFQGKMALAFVTIVIISIVGFTQLGFSNRLKDQFAARTKINTDTQWFEDNIGPVIPFELLVRFPESAKLRPSQCLGYVHSLQEKLESMGLQSKTLAATSLVPYLPGTGARQSIRRAVMDKRLESMTRALEETGYVLREDDVQLWRVTMFAYSSSDVTMSDYYRSIRKVLQQQREEFTDSGFDEDISYSGLGSRMAVITDQLGGGLATSCVTSVALILLVLIVALRSLTLGVTAMIPNIFPVAFSFGMFGYFQPNLDIGSIMTASIAMGIAVDDTIHFMYWFKKALSQSLSRDDALRVAIRKSGRAIAATSLICGLGFCVYFFCDFMPVARFGQLLFFMLLAALIGDLLFLPALLRSLPEKLLKRQS